MSFSLCEGDSPCNRKSQLRTAANGHNSPADNQYKLNKMCNADTVSAISRKGRAQKSFTELL